MGKILLIILVLAGTAYYFLPKMLGGGANPMAMMGAMPVMVADAVEKQVTLWDEFSGRLKAVEDVQVRPRVPGMIESVHFSDGQMVKEGDLLFVIDPRPYEAEVQAARARAELAEAEFKRADTLFGEKAISQRDYDQRKNNVNVARADLKRAQLNLDYTKVKAPVSGKAGRVEVTPGNLVDAGMPVLTTVVSQDPIYADFEADEQRFLSYLSAAGNDTAKLSTIPVLLELGNNEIHEGHIHSFDNQLNAGSGTIRIRAVFDNKEGKLVPGLFARLRMGAAGSETAVLVAEKAINTDQNKKFVYTLDAENKTAYREVKLGPSHEGMRIIRSGLAKGDTIIVSSTRLLRPGMPVTPNKVGMEETDKHQVPAPAAPDTAAAEAQAPAAEPAETKE